MKYLTILIMSLMILSCNRHKDELYYNLDLKVVNIGQNSDVSNNKFRMPTSITSVLLKDTINNTYCIMTNNRYSNDDNALYIRLSSEKIYNMRPGDLLHFDYIRKKRFFKIKDSIQVK